LAFHESFLLANLIIDASLVPGCSAVAPLSAMEAKRHKNKQWLEITSEFSKPPAFGWE